MSDFEIIVTFTSVLIGMDECTDEILVFSEVLIDSDKTFVQFGYEVSCFVNKLVAEDVVSFSLDVLNCFVKIFEIFDNSEETEGFKDISCVFDICVTVCVEVCLCIDIAVVILCLRVARSDLVVLGVALGGTLAKDAVVK